eukprot:TRINITY_DN1365_c0_g1_i1.p1 TRINITY_DN1365_c0_g1~~TRINITY_DN1365_c0_g1_i1.p1  ORF type:complete len:323 (+),score=101.42 TRINITY_DN1365_c0_g1_i1:1-969(+)
MSEQSITVMVTGGSGLVGKAIEAMKEKDETMASWNWVFLRSKDGDLRDRDATEALFKQHQPTHIIHLAATVGGLFANMVQQVEFFRENSAINDNILSLSHAYGVQKVVSCLSTCIFPAEIEFPIKETDVHNGPPHDSNYGYAFAKRMLEVETRAYQEEYGCKFTTVIPTNVYGPHDNFDPEKSHVIPGLLHKCYLAKHQDKDFVMYGTGKPLRQFIYSEDLAELMLWCLQNYEEKEPIILAPDEEDELSIRQVTESIMKAMGYEGELKIDDTKSDGIYKKTASNAKLRSYLPDYKFTEFEEGITKTAQWFEENYDTARTGKK